MEEEGFVVVGVEVGVVDATEAACAWLDEARAEGLRRLVVEHDAGGAARARIDGFEVVCERLVGEGPPRYLVRMTVGCGPVEGLTARQREVAVLAARGASAREIAEHLGIGIYTVKQHLAAVYERLGVGSRVELAEALRGGRGRE